MNAVMRCPLATVHPPGYLIQVITDAGKVTQQHRRQRGEFSGSRRSFTKTDRTHPRRQLFTLATLQQLLIFRICHSDT